jgi:hypothetical protein
VDNNVDLKTISRRQKLKKNHRTSFSNIFEEKDGIGGDCPPRGVTMAGPSDVVGRVTAVVTEGAGGRAARVNVAAEARAAVRGGGAAAEAWRSAGGLPPLVELFRLIANTKRPGNSSDLALGHVMSALADCCLDSESCEEVRLSSYHHINNVPNLSILDR